MADNIIWSTIYLGNFADMDTDESSTTQEKSSALLTTFGAGPGNALANNIVDVHTYAGEEDSTVNTNNSSSSDYIRYDLGAGTVTADIDSVALLSGTVTFFDGSTYSSNFGVFQDEYGNVFMMLLDSQPELASQGIDTVTFSSVVTTNYVAEDQFNKNDHDFVCFGPGVRIATPFGPKRADKLEPGDLVTTLDDGPQPIRWIGKRRLWFDTPHPAQPVRIKESAFGAGLPSRDMLLSPNHRVLLRTEPTDALHDPLGVLAPVKALTRRPGIRYAAGRHAITYYSFLLPGHAVLIAEGIAVESLYPGPAAWAGLTGDDRSAWMRLAASARVTGVPPARLLLSTGEARAGLDAGTMHLPATPPVALSWSARNRRPRPNLPAHLAARTATRTL